MRRLVVLVALALSALPASAQQRAPDAAGARDHPLVGRYEGARLAAQNARAFEESRLINRPVTATDMRAEGNQRRNARNSIEVAGRTWRFRYEGPAGRSSLEVLRSLEEGLRGRGFATVFQCRARECGSGDGADLYFALTDHPMNPAGGHGMPANHPTSVYLLARLERPQGDVFVAVYAVDRPASGNQPTVPVVLVDVVEARPMDAGRIVFVDAGAMQRAIAETGRVALYGILFDFDRADIRPESRPTLEEIARYLRANPAVALVVAGHTDARGAFDYNVTLSMRRAAAVVQALTREFGIAPERLTPFGAGMAAPVATNETEEGRQRNRRVELVRR